MESKRGKQGHAILVVECFSLLLVAMEYILLSKIRLVGITTMYDFGQK